MKILALEFSSSQRSVAVVQQQHAEDKPEEHQLIESGSGQILELIEKLLRQAGLEREEIEVITVGLGPGSYTGIRGAIALAQGWQLGREVHLLGLSSADCVAAQACEEGLTGTMAVTIDAQRGEFYVANYELSPPRWHQVQPLRLAAPQVVLDCQNQGQLVIGPEVGMAFPGAQVVWPRAAALARMALLKKDFVQAEQLQPLYLRQTAFVKAARPRPLPE
jgi:tRNA threonylcarbamoyladenosine biosynthesis protein TsaB